MGSLIEYCRHNGNCTVNELLLESDFDVDVRFCLDRCGECYESPFLVVDGEVVRGDTHGGLLEDVSKSEAKGEKRDNEEEMKEVESAENVANAAEDG